MPNPTSPYDEWIEIYNPENLNLNLSEWQVKVNTSSYSFTCNNVPGCFLITNATYLLIVGKKANISQITNESIIYYNASDVSNYFLPNDGRPLFLYDGSVLIDNVTYPSFSSDQGKSWALCNGTWNKTLPTPGLPNNCSQQQFNESSPLISLQFPLQVYNNKTNFTITINLLNFSSGYYDLKIDIKNGSKYLNRVWYSNEWSSKNDWLENFVFINSENFTLTAINIIDTDDFFTGNATLQFKLRNSTKEFKSEIFNITILNETRKENQMNNKVIKLICPSGVKCNENFSLTLEAYNFSDGFYDVKIDILSEEEKRIGKVWNGSKWISTYSYLYSILNVVNGYGSAIFLFKIENYDGEAILRPRLRKTGSSSYEDFDERYVTVLCSQESRENESKLKITSVPIKAKFGSTLEVGVEIYRGDTKKYAVYVYAQDKNGKKVSSTATIHMDKKFSEFGDDVEIELKCLNESGTYEVIVEGLDGKDKEDIYIRSCGEEIQEIENSQEEDQKERDKYFQDNDVIEHKIENKPDFLTGAVITDKSSKITNVLIFVLLSLSLLFVIYLIIKKI